MVNVFEVPVTPQLFRQRECRLNIRCGHWHRRSQQPDSPVGPKETGKCRIAVAFHPLSAGLSGGGDFSSDTSPECGCHVGKHMSPPGLSGCPMNIGDLPTLKLQENHGEVVMTPTIRRTPNC